MSTSIKLPQWGMSMSEGEISQWLVAEGDTVEVDQELVEIEAAKAVSVIPSPVAGMVGPLLFQEGETAQINDILCEIYTPGESLPSEESPASEPGDGASAGSAILPATDLGASDDGVPRDADAAREASGRVTFVVPLARKIAKENDVDLHTVTGTGLRGRITAADVRAAVESTRTSTRLVAQSTSEPAPPPAAVSATAPSTSPGVETKLTSMRKIIGERMMASLHDAAQLTLSSTADVTDFAQFRATVGASESKPSYVAAVIRACALALRDHPGVNAYIDNDTLITAKHVNIGTAVALDDGLVVPVLQDADTLSLAATNDTVRSLSGAARDGSIDPDAYSGGTFSVSSLGGQGIDGFTPVLNPPQAAILGIGRTREVPIRYGAGIAWRQEVTLSLTIDHRIIDGYPGARFLETVANYLENPRKLL